MLNESLTMIANLALFLFVMTGMMAKYMSLKDKPVELVACLAYGSHICSRQIPGFTLQ